MSVLLDRPSCVVAASHTRFLSQNPTRKKSHAEIILKTQEKVTWSDGFKDAIKSHMG